MTAGPGVRHPSLRPPGNRALRLLAAGLSNTEIATRLVLSDRTVDKPTVPSDEPRYERYALTVRSAHQILA